MAAGFAVPCSAQVAVEGALQTDYRVRGYSVSDEEPAASLVVSYDDPSGAYAGASLVGSTYDGDPVLIQIQGSAGYAVRIGPTLSLDAGVSRTQYFYGFGTRRNYDYTEIYAGVALPLFSARLSYSPDYYHDDMESLYAEIETGIAPAPDWFVSAHAGVLRYLGAAPGYLAEQTVDWRLGATRQLGPWGVHLDLSGRVQGRERYPVRNRVSSGSDNVALVASLTRTL